MESVRSINQSLNDLKRLKARGQELARILERSVTQRETLESTRTLTVSLSAK